MKRITFEGNFCDISMCRENPCPYDDACTQRQVWERLKQYEDTGLEPEETKDILERYRAFRSAISDETGKPMISWTRAGEICRAEQDGRLVVLPCKVGDTVYGHNKTEVSEYKVSVISLATYNWYLRCQNKNSDFWVTDADIGRTVYLTREEAEKALKGEHDG